MLTYLTISLFESPAQTLVNAVNTVGVMGKGVAAVFRELYPEMYRRYRRLCSQGQLDIGKLYLYRTADRIVVNLPTKRHWRQRSRPEYVEAGLAKFVACYGEYGISSVSFPQLGCGHGELNWESQVRPLMERYLGDLPIPVYIHLHPTAPDFVPERLDADYARQVRLERQRISSEELWRDLRLLVGESYQLTLFGPLVTMDDGHVFFRPLGEDSQPVTVFREDIEDLWNTLRLRKVVPEMDIPVPMEGAGAVGWLVELLKRLEYIRPVQLGPSGSSRPGLLYAPRANPKPIEQAEIVL